MSFQVTSRIGFVQKSKVFIRDRSRTCSSQRTLLSRQAWCMQSPVISRLQSLVPRNRWDSMVDSMVPIGDTPTLDCFSASQLRRSSGRRHGGGAADRHHRSAAWIDACRAHGRPGNRLVSCCPNGGILVVVLVAVGYGRSAIELLLSFEKHFLCE